MGTVWVIEAAGGETAGGPGARVVVDRAVRSAFNEIVRVERWASRFLPDSDVSRINRAAGFGEQAWVTCEPELAALLRRCVAYAHETDGYFDVTVGGLLRDTGDVTPAAGLVQLGLSHCAWLRRRRKRRQLASRPGGRRPPRMRSHAVNSSDDVETDRRRWHDGVCGIEFLEVADDAPRVRLTHPGVALDLGGVAKGYAVDRAVEVLRRAGVEQAAVNAGGMVRAFGLNDARFVSVRHPMRPGRDVTRVALRDGAVATSGNYERRVQGLDGHVIDPVARCGAASLLSVSVAARTAETADVYSTALFAMGRGRAAAFAERRGLRAVLVERGRFWFRHHVLSYL